ncbi:MAG TPA: TonB-dependent siderophore receptor, partial [Verrucomicrobiae bacterium]|nr:TonB-dependent siderophore receptor [Verrucomicrobiae bacterium]
MTKSKHRPSQKKKNPKAVKRALKLTTLILAHDFVSSAQAQSTHAAPAAADSTNAPSQKLPDVVVTGEKDSYKTDEVALPKLTEPLRDTPQSITVVPREVMQDQNTTTLRDVLRNVAGISIAAGEGGSQGDNLTLRGFTARNDIFLDGMRDYGSYYRDPFNYEAVDVLQGPASVMFGRGSTGGIINQESKTPGLSPFVGGTLSLGTDNTRRATVDINQPVSELGTNTAVRLNLMGNDSQVAGRDLGENRRFGIAPSIAFGIGTPTTLTLSYLHQSEDDIPDYGLPWLKFNGHAAPVDRSNFYGFKSDYLRTDVDMVTAKLEHQVNENISLRDQLRWANYTRDFRITEPQVLATNAAPLDTLVVNRNELAGQSTETFLWDQFDATIDLNTGPVEHTLVGGAEGGRETSDPARFAFTGVPGTSLVSPNENQNFTATSSSIRSKIATTATSFGFYALDTMKFGEHWELSGGARWDYFDADSQDRLHPTNSFHQTITKPSWRGALVYKPVEQGSFYFSYGTSWNPSAETLSLSAANQDIPPENNETFEFGTKWDLLQNRLSVRGSVFRTEKSNARETNPTNTLEVVDGGVQRVDGFELALSGHLTKEWQVFASYDYLASEVVSSKFFPRAVGRPLNNVPHNTFSLWTTYELPLNLEVGGGLNVVSSRTANTATLGATTIPERVGGYWTLNAMVKYKLSHRISMQANVYNLTDNYYLDQLHPAHVIPGAGI